MTFNNIELYCQVLGSIMKDPQLLINYSPPVMMDDFSKDNPVARVVYQGMVGLIESGATNINITTIETFLNNYGTMKAIYNSNHGADFVHMCLEKGQPENFSSFYSQLKKNSLLRDLKEHNYDISPFDFESVEPGTKKEFECIERYEAATEEDILAYVEKSFSELRSRHSSTLSLSQTRIGDDIDTILSELGQFSDQGAELRGNMFNSIVRGARLGKMYVRSASTSGGKTRSSMFDACNIAFPYRYDCTHRCFRYIDGFEPQKVLFITTEQTPREIKTMALAFLSGVEERKILTNTMNSGEVERVKIAAEITKKYSDYFIMEEINDPNLNNVQNVIKKNILLNDVKYIFYDYIFTSPSLISQFSKTGIREDVALGMLSNQLKEIAKTYDVFVMTSTQLNGDGLQPGVKRDQRMIRGAKSIADKCDIGMIITAVDKTDLEKVNSFATKVGIAPSHVIDIYKVRSGRFKNVRLWTWYNLGNGDRRDLFITDSDNNLMEFEPYELVASLEDASRAMTNQEVLNALRKDEF